MAKNTTIIKTIDEDLSDFEKDIRQLKIEYEQYFGGGRKRPPTEIEWRIETMMKRYSDRGGHMSFAQRYHYGNLAQMYTKYREMFRKRAKQKEEGTVQRHFGAAAREIEAERTRKHATSKREDGAHFPFAVSWKDPDHEKKKVEQLFAAFREAKSEAGEETERLTLEAFQQFVRQKTNELQKHRGQEEIEYVVSLDSHHARLKARVKS